MILPLQAQSKSCDTHNPSPNKIKMNRGTKESHKQTLVPRIIKVLCEQTRELTHDFLDYV